MNLDVSVPVLYRKALSAARISSDMASRSRRPVLAVQKGKSRSVAAVDHGRTAIQRRAQYGSCE